MKVISFDVDATLVDPSFADFVWLEGVPQLYSEKHDVDFKTAKKRVVEAYEEVGEDDIRWYRLDYWFNVFRLDGSPRDLLQKYKDRIKVYEEVPQVLDSLRKKYTLIVASNAHRDFLSLTLSSIEFYFDHIFSATSDFNQVGKYQNFYREILRFLKVNPQEVIHVGDHRVFDCEVPSSLGIHAFLLDRKGGRGLKDLKEFERKVKELEKN